MNIQTKTTIPFNKPFSTGKEIKYIREALQSGKISGDGNFTKKCNALFKEKFGFENVLLTTSCTDALEMAAILLDIKEGDEVIMPSFTFVSTANAFVLRGAKIVFADSNLHNPNIDAFQLENLITDKTKAIVVVHYSGIACDMDKILEIADKYGIFVVEDAAQAINSFYKNKPLGSFGCLATFSFHETKNISSGEGGMLAINNKKFINRAEIIREKGTNRSSFFRGEINKYSWVDIGSSFLPSDITAAFLLAQLESLDTIQQKRNLIWKTYYQELISLEASGAIILPKIDDFATNNGHIFYILCAHEEERSALISFLKINGIMATFHYLSLHKSQFYATKHDGRLLPNSDRYSDSLLRLPLYCTLQKKQILFICKLIRDFYKNKKM